MLIGHIPAGYLLTKKLQAMHGRSDYLWIGLIASVFSDFDLPYYYFVDHHQHLHHGYWTHIPIYWSLAFLCTYGIGYLLKSKDLLFIALCFFLNIFLHLILDTIVGKIEWLYPFSAWSFSLFNVPNQYGWWVYNFVFHWTFLLEIAVIMWAVFVVFRKNFRAKVLPIEKKPTK